MGGICAARREHPSLKHPEAIGSWLPKVRASWYKAQVEVEKARRLHAEIMEANIIVIGAGERGEQR
jgi:hypothetical protein